MKVGIDCAEKELVYEIRAGLIKPGRGFPCEAELADRFGISRPSVREIKDRLKAKGLIVTKRSCRSVVEGDAVGTKRMIGVILSGRNYCEAFEERRGAIAESALQRGFDVLMEDVVDCRPIEVLSRTQEAAKKFLGLGACGIVYQPGLGVAEEGRQVLSMAKTAGADVVAVGTDGGLQDRFLGCDCVGMDAFGAGRKVGSILREMKCPSACFVAPSFGEPVAECYFAGIDWELCGFASTKRMELGAGECARLAGFMRDNPGVNVYLFSDAQHADGLIKGLPSVGLRMSSDMFFSGIAESMPPPSCMSAWHVPDYASIVERAVDCAINRANHPGRSPLRIAVPAVFGRRRHTPPSCGL